MLYPSIQELLTATAKDGQEKLNKYSAVMAAAKCARIITNEYIEERHIAEKKVANKETEKDISSLINKSYRDEKAVKNALREIKEGKFEIYLPNEEGYDEAVVEVVDYVEPKEEFRPYKLVVFDKQDESNEEDEGVEAEEAETDENYEFFDSEDLMGAEEVFTNEEGYSVAEFDDEK